ncbi:MAG TPA: FAD-dependent oxidoreductase, partial [Chloroflexota bacterium]
MVDVVVVGASVAGATTAVHLARAGHSVLLLERSTAPRRKACGEGLFPAGVAELERLGVLPTLLPHAHVLDSL